MPGRLPVDGKKVIEYRITLGGTEREALKSLVTSARIQSLAGDDGILNELGSVDNVIGKLAVAGFLLELLGVTDIFDFDDDAKAKAMQIKEKVEGNVQDAIVRNELEGVGVSQILGAINQLMRSLD
tara:strand:- start:86 stop:463 length:378 start_codon:yes stop_codon:yes gene_type:complete